MIYFDEIVSIICLIFIIYPSITPEEEEDT
jgi:hypothetical protein